MATCLTDRGGQRIDWEKGSFKLVWTARNPMAGRFALVRFDCGCKENMTVWLADKLADAMP